jgi:hypothetical protein
LSEYNHPFHALFYQLATWDSNDTMIFRQNANNLLQSFSENNEYEQMAVHHLKHKENHTPTNKFSKSLLKNAKKMMGQSIDYSKNQPSILPIYSNIIINKKRAFISIMLLMKKM